MTRPNRDEYACELHQRLVEGDALAPSELIETLIEELITRVRSKAQISRDNTLVIDAVTDTLLAYVQQPDKYNPGKSSLVTYLTMSAYKDFLNLFERERRRSNREISIEDVEHRRLSGNKCIESIEGKIVNPEGILTSSERKSLWMRALEQFPDSKDRRILILMLEGERNTSAYSAILGIQNLVCDEQRRVVKRNKDRINKRLARLGNKLREQND